MAKFYAVKEEKNQEFIILGMNVKNKSMVIQELFINLLQMKKRQKHL